MIIAGTGTAMKALAAAAIAAKKAATLLPVIFAVIPLSIIELQAMIGERGIAVIFAVIANTIRWVRFTPGWRDVAFGYLVGSVAAFIAAKWRVPVLDAMVQMSPEDVWMLNGAFFGTFCTAGYTFLIEWAKAFADRKLAP